MFSNIEEYRRAIVLSQIRNKTREAWNHWAPMVRDKLGASPNSKQIVYLANDLRDIFKSSGKSGRDQSELSSSGANWENFIIWYLNLLSVGTNVIVTKPVNEFRPAVLSDVLTVSFSNNRTNSEADLIAFSIPDLENLNKSGFDINSLDGHLRRNITDVSLSVLQCKTNWNDNAQAPMLWGLIYEGASQGQRIHNTLRVGTGGVNLQNLANFSYGFATVPSNDPQKINSKSLQVLRVASLSAGNFWGMAHKPGVASPLSEFLPLNFPSMYDKGMEQSLNEWLDAKRTAVDYFFKLDQMNP